MKLKNNINVNNIKFEDIRSVKNKTKANGKANTYKQSHSSKFLNKMIVLGVRVVARCWSNRMESVSGLVSGVREVMVVVRYYFRWDGQEGPLINRYGFTLWCLTSKMSAHNNAQRAFTGGREYSRRFLEEKINSPLHGDEKLNKFRQNMSFSIFCHYQLSVFR